MSGDARQGPARREGVHPACTTIGRKVGETRRAAHRVQSLTGRGRRPHLFLNGRHAPHFPYEAARLRLSLSGAAKPRPVFLAIRRGLLPLREGSLPAGRDDRLGARLRA